MSNLDRAMTPRHFDLALAYPQWQGSGRHTNLPRGARATAEACARFAPMAHVPMADGDDVAIGGVNRWRAIYDQFLAARALLEHHAPRRLLTGGGDCAVDIASIDYLRRRYPDLSVLWIDAHLDANTPETSPSGSFHGMPVAAVLGRAPAALRAHLGAPVDRSRFHYFGIHVGDEGDWAFQREHALVLHESPPRLSGPVHIHFDLDVLDPVEFPHLAYTDGTLSIANAVALVEQVARDADVVGLTITEFSPVDDDAARAGSAVIARLCAAASVGGAGSA